MSDPGSTGGVGSPTMPRLRGPSFTPFSPKSVKNGPKRGYPLFLTGKSMVPPTRGVFRPGGPSRAVFLCFFGLKIERKSDFWGVYSHVDPLGRWCKLKGR